MESAKKLLLNLNDFVLDLVFPKFCVGCHKEGTWLCSKCQEKIIMINTSFCPMCQRITPKGQYCKNCRKKVDLNGVVIAAHYEKKGVLKEAIHTFKYDHITDLGKDLSLLLTKALKKRNIKNIIILPVPLSKRRYSERGYNQSQILAQEVSKKISSKIISNKLIRKKHKIRQVELSRTQRIDNMKGVFSWAGKDEIKNKTVFVLDDVFTTGATLNEAAKVLKQQAQAKQVWGLVLGKG